MTSDAATPATTPDHPTIYDHLTRSFAPLVDAATVQRVFGDPIVHGDRLVIPMARVTTMVGFGGGSGETTSDAGSGGGGGGRTKVSPVGALELNADGVHVHYSPNVTARIVLTIALVIAWTVFWVMVALRRAREQQPPAGNARRFFRRP